MEIIRSLIFLLLCRVVTSLPLITCNERWLPLTSTLSSFLMFPCHQPFQKQPAHYNNKLSSLFAQVDKGLNILEIASGVVPQSAVVLAAKKSWKFLWQRLMTELAPQNPDGSYNRPTYTYRHGNQIGLSPQFPDVSHRYQIFVGNPCPWCHRVLLTVGMLGFTSQQIRITKLIDDPMKASRGGWILPSSSSSSSSSISSASSIDPVFGQCRDLREVYDLCQPGYTGRCTAPLLVDAVSKTIVSNESADIIRMLNQCYFIDSRLSSSARSVVTNDSPTTRIDLYPKSYSTIIDDTNDWIYRLLNNGVYRCGFCTQQGAYDVAVQDVLCGLQKCNTILASQQYITHPTQFTESDVRLLPTLLRFDGVYAPLFRAGGGVIRLRDFPHVHQYLQHCWSTYQVVRDSIDLSDACQSYYKQLFPLNPSGILPPPVTATMIGLNPVSQ
jgi:glutathionyl-hydroquinone reductase